MRAASYSTHMVGKWDTGMATPQHTPAGRGYDTTMIYFHHANVRSNPPIRYHGAAWPPRSPARGSPARCCRCSPLERKRRCTQDYWSFRDGKACNKSGPPDGGFGGGAVGGTVDLWNDYTGVPDKFGRPGHEYQNDAGCTEGHQSAAGGGKRSHGR
jgi:hypothetical protein